MPTINSIHMMPSIDFAEQRRFRQGSQAAELIDYFAAHFHGRPKKFTVPRQG